MRNIVWSWPSLAGGLVATLVDARAAAGHFDVDDATVLDPGHCQYETWLARAPGLSTTLFHLGPSCRVGPVEAGLNYDRLRSADERRDGFGPQLKWVVDPLVDRFSVGAAWNASFNLVHGGRPWQSLYVPVTWWAAEKLWIHVNAGADWSPAGERTRRLGVSGEWAVNDSLSVIAERVTFYGDWTSRIGTRFNLDESISIDVSAARTGPQRAHLFAIGLNRDFKP